MVLSSGQVSTPLLPAKGVKGDKVCWHLLCDKGSLQRSPQLISSVRAQLGRGGLTVEDSDSTLDVLLTLEHKSSNNWHMWCLVSDGGNTVSVRPLGVSLCWLTLQEKQLWAHEYLEICTH